jgi:hypothetical protein
MQRRDDGKEWHGQHQEPNQCVIVAHQAPHDSRARASSHPRSWVYAFHAIPPQPPPKTTTSQHPPTPRPQTPKARPYSTHENQNPKPDPPHHNPRRAQPFPTCEPSAAPRILPRSKGGQPPYPQTWPPWPPSIPSLPAAELSDTRGALAPAWPPCPQQNRGPPSLRRFVASSLSCVAPYLPRIDKPFQHRQTPPPKTWRSWRPYVSSAANPFLSTTHLRDSPSVGDLGDLGVPTTNPETARHPAAKPRPLRHFVTTSLRHCNPSLPHLPTSPLPLSSKMINPRAQNHDHLDHLEIPAPTSRQNPTTTNTAPTLAQHPRSPWTAPGPQHDHLARRFRCIPVAPRRAPRQRQKPSGRAPFPLSHVPTPPPPT